MKTCEDTLDSNELRAETLSLLQQQFQATISPQSHD